MNTVEYLLVTVPGCMGAADLGDSYRLDFDGSSRPATPEEVRAAVVADVTERIKTMRQQRQESLGFPVNLPSIGVVRFHSDAHSRSQHSGLMSTALAMLIQGATTATPIGSPQVEWKTMGGTKVPLSVGVVLALMQASLVWEASQHAAADAHIAALAASPDPAAYDFGGGWPA